MTWCEDNRIGNGEFLIGAAGAFGFASMKGLLAKVMSGIIESYQL
jgi:hypothetical protein